MAFSIEIWRSLAGSVWPDDFSLLTTVPDGNPWSYLDSPTVKGSLYIYRTRRHDDISSVYTDWSPFIYILGPYPKGTDMLNQYTNPNPGFATKGGMVIEGTSGQICKVSRLLSLISFDPGKSGMKRIERDDFRGLPGVVGLINGEAEYSSKLVVAGTPESFDEIFCTYYGAPTTTAVGAPAAPAAPIITQGGTPGLITSSYTVYAVSPQGDSVASSAGATTTGPTTLSGTNYNIVTWLPVAGATSYKVRKGANIIGQTQGLTLNDIGQTGSAYSAPASPTGNQQKWTANNGFLTGSMAFLFGYGQNGVVANPMVRAYSGVRGDKMTLKFEKKSTTPFRLECDLKALYDIDGLSLSQSGLDVATYDTLDPYSETFSVVMIGGALAACNGFTLSQDVNLGSTDVFNGFAGPNAFYKQSAKHRLTLMLAFQNDLERQRYFGVVNQSSAYAQINNVKYFPVELVVANVINGAGIINQFGIYAAYAAYNTVGEAIKGKDGEIMQEMEIIPTIDPGSTGTDLVITNVNSRSNGSIIGPGTLMTSINAGAINPWVN